MRAGDLLAGITLPVAQRYQYAAESQGEPPSDEPGNERDTEDAEQQQAQQIASRTAERLRSQTQVQLASNSILVMNGRGETTLTRCQSVLGRTLPGFGHDTVVERIDRCMLDQRVLVHCARMMFRLRLSLAAIGSATEAAT